MKARLYSVLLAGAVLLSACDGGPFASTDALRNRAAQSLEQKNFTAAAKDAEALIQKQPEGHGGYFMLAQARTQLGDNNAGIAALELAISKGYKDDIAISGNTNLQPLHALSAYSELMDRAFPRRAPAATVAGDASITDTADKTVIRAGDVVVELPKEK